MQQWAGLYDSKIILHGNKNYNRVVIENYGHNDCMYGKNADVDVFPHILNHLEKVTADH